MQFTPDLLPSDITGSFLYNQREGTFSFRRGPVFTHLLLADEINRATPKTQAAAELRGRDFVTQDDVKAMAVPVLAHRLILQPELWVTKVTEDEIVRDLLHKVRWWTSDSCTPCRTCRHGPLRCSCSRSRW
jgi:MoxR-like ATPase